MLPLIKMVCSCLVGSATVSFDIDVRVVREWKCAVRANLLNVERKAEITEGAQYPIST